MTNTRQVGEVVAWHLKVGLSAKYSDTAASEWIASEWRDYEPLIPASDLEQVSRERDGLEAWLQREIDKVATEAAIHDPATAARLHALNDVMDALNTMDDRDGGESV